MEDKAKTTETVGEEQQQQEFRSRKRPLLYECPKLAEFGEDFELLRKIKKLNRNVDVALTRRRLFIGQELRDPSEVDRVLRIHVYHTYAQDDSNPGVYNWTLNVLGHILDPVTNQPVTSEVEKNQYNLVKMAYQMSVVCDPAEKVVGDTGRFDWVRKENDETSECDGFSVTRQGTGPCTALVYVFLDSSKKYFKLSDQLLAITGARPCAQYSTMEAIVNSIYVYARRNGCLTPQNPGIIRCDHKLHQIFANEYVALSNVEEAVKSHMRPAQPLMFHHKIKFDGTPQENCECYEVLVKVPLHTGVAAASNVMQVYPTQAEADTTHQRLDMINEQIQEIYGEIEAKKQDYNFFKAYSKSPVDAIDVTIASAERLLKNVAEYGHEWKQKAVSDYYKGNWVNRAITRFISQQTGMQQQIPNPAPAPQT